MNIRGVGYDELQLCPAAVEVDENGKATILVNTITFPPADSFAQKFYLAHELGHYLLNTNQEEIADTFAIGLLAGTEHKSLKKSLDALYRLHTIPYSRLLTLYNTALKIDKQHQQQKTTLTMKKKIWDNPRPSFLINRADGDDAPVDTNANSEAQAALTAANVLGDIIGGNNRRRAGLRINNVFFSLESILMAAILVAVVVLCTKK